MITIMEIMSHHKRRIDKASTDAAVALIAAGIEPGAYLRTDGDYIFRVTSVSHRDGFIQPKGVHMPKGMNRFGPDVYPIIGWEDAEILSESDIAHLMHINPPY